MNRRESRVSMNARQNDALSEFKSCSPNVPVCPRLSGAPTIPFILEDIEPSDAPEDDDQSTEKMPSPRCKNEPQWPSASRLSSPSRTPSPLPVAPSVDLYARLTKRKLRRRRSELLVHQDNSVVGSQEAGEDNEKAADVNQTDALNGFNEGRKPSFKKEKRRISRVKGQQKEREYEALANNKLRDEASGERKKLKLADVTNSPGIRSSQSVDIVVSGAEIECAMSASSRTEFVTSSSSTLLPSDSHPNLISDFSKPTESSSAPSLPLPDTKDVDHESGFAPTGGRERRMRKSVNYTEPKLNTYQNAESESVASSSRIHKSAAAITTRRTEDGLTEHKVTADSDDYDTGEARPCLESPGNRIRQSKSQPTAIVQIPLPASRSGYPTDIPSQSLASATSTASLSTRRTRPRSYMYAAEDDSSSQSDDADSEYVSKDEGW
ncbi:hypothetical protein C8R42DRAFT_726366 [Lentinula raphanica]|nr:hypothetical protein C8R42DRAFT_726366 [Lentinula raphanica]